MGNHMTMNQFQTTLRDSVHLTGIGLHSGNPVRMDLLPAAVDTGVVFERPGSDGEWHRVPARADLVTETTLCTALTCDDHRVATVEHVLSAVTGLGLDNVVIRLSAAEVPIVDGSAGPFVFLIQSTGLREQDAPRRYLRLRQPVQVQDGDKWARIEPYDGFRLSFSIDFEHPAIEAGQCVTVDITPETYIRELSRARTFGFLRDIEYLRQHDMALGGSLDNAIVLDDYRVLNDEGLRYGDEFVRHKVLDAVGDLALLGAPLRAQYTGFKAGHALNNQLARAVLNNPDCYDWTTAPKPSASPAARAEAAA